MTSISTCRRFDSIAESCQVASELKTEASRKPLPFRPGPCSITSCMVATVAVQSREGLGFCEHRDEGSTTILAREPIAPAHSSSREALRDNQSDWLAYVPPQLRDAFESECRGHKGRSTIFAPCQQPDNAGHLHPSVDSREAGGTNQNGSNDSA